MTRIIRLTESDLTRIVKRVIKEQQQVAGTPVETVTFTPVDVETFTSTANNTWSLYLNRNNIPWTITPWVVKDSKGVVIPKRIRLRITPKGSPQLFADVYITCAGTRQNYVSPQPAAVSNIDTNVVKTMADTGYTLIRDRAETYKGDNLIKGINHAIGKGAFPLNFYVGTIKTLGDQFCEKV
jgi:hypothetical protein